MDDIILKKLILVRQLFQKAVLQTETLHSYVDRIMAIIVFDLANETMLKVVVSSIAPQNEGPDDQFHKLITQANRLLASTNRPTLPDTAKIKHVHSLRNDAQHKAKYPNELDLSDCRTYTRDFLKQITIDIWNRDFESISLVDIVQNAKVKKYLFEAEAELAKGDYNRAVLKAIAAVDWTMTIIRPTIVKEIPYNTRAIVVTDGSERQKESFELLEVFEHMRNTIMRSVIGVSFPGYLKFRQITRSVGWVTFFDDGDFDMNQTVNASANVKEAEYVVEFAISTVLQIESLVGDIDKPFAQ